jgi:hypothetical protein
MTELDQQKSRATVRPDFKSCQLSSVVEQRFRKPQVPSSSLGVGSEKSSK